MNSDLRLDSLNGPGSASLKGHGAGESASNESCCGALELAARYVLAATRRDSRNFVVGMAVIAIVVAFCAAVQSAIESTPVSWR